MTDTPETDDCVKTNKHLRFLEENHWSESGKFTYTNPIVNLCKKLERERNKAQERADTMFAKYVDILEQTRNERDDLAAALNRACANPTTGNWYREAQDALAAWKERRKSQHQNTNQND